MILELAASDVGPPDRPWFVTRTAAGKVSMKTMALWQVEDTAHPQGAGEFLLL